MEIDRPDEDFAVQILHGLMYIRCTKMQMHLTTGNVRDSYHTGQREE